MNAVFFAIVLVAFLTAALRQFAGTAGPAPMEAVGAAMIEAAGGSVTLAIGLIGVMALFLGLMKVAEAGGLLTVIARLLRPLMVRLFPEVPPDHPAMGAMILNIAASALGLGNAATPLGIRAMQGLDSLNPHKGTATDAMALFLAINTATLTLLPTTVIAARAAAGSTDPAGIVPTALFASICSMAAAIAAAKLLQRLYPLPPAPAPAGEAAPAPLLPDCGDDHPGKAYPAWVSLLALAGLFALVPLTLLYGRAVAAWIIPGLTVGLLGFGMMRGVRVYDLFVEGAREGFEVAVRIIPYLVAILVAVAMFRASGAMDLLVRPLGIVTTPLGLPPEALPMALLRSLSGSGAYGVMAAILQDPAIGPDSYVGYLVSTIQGSSETTFYVLAVYFGAVQVRRIRHALAAGLIADAAGVAGSVAICLYLFGPGV